MSENMSFTEQIKQVLKKWWLVLILGIVTVLIGIWYAANTGAGFTLAQIILEANFLSVGIVGAAVIFANREFIPAWGWDFVAALLVIVLAFVLILNPGFTQAVMVNIYAAGFVVEGIGCIFSFVALKKLAIKNKATIWILVFGILSVILGIFLFLNPAVSFLSIDILVCASIFSIGIALIATSIAMSKAKSSVEAIEKNVEETAKEIEKEAKAVLKEYQKMQEEAEKKIEQ